MKLILNPNNAMKKAVILSVFVIFGSVVNVCGYDFEVGASWDIQFQINGIFYGANFGSNSAVVTSGSVVYSGNITIPSMITYNGTTYNVVAIDNSAFANSDVTNVIISNSIDVIGNQAFGGCYSLANVTIPNSVTYIGDKAFMYCYGLTSVYFKGTNLPTFNNSSYYCYGANTTFYGCNSAFYYVPCSTKNAYQTALGVSEDKIIELLTYNLSVSSSDTLLGNVLITQQPSCQESAGIQATAKPHCYFVRWSDNDTSRSRNIIVASDTSLIAFFEYDKHTITVVGSKGTVAGSGIYDYGTSVILNAEAEEHYHFVGWSDGDTSKTRMITVTGDSTYTAIFEIDKHIISDSCANGYVLGIGEYNYGDTVTITAMPDEHYSFMSWIDGDTSESESFVLVGDTVVAAIFDLTQYNISATCEHGVVTGYGVYRYPDVVTLTVEPDKGYRFVEWSDGNGYNPRVFVAEEDLTIEAICEEAPEVGVDDVKDNYPQFYVVGNIIYNSANELLRVYSASGKLLQQSEINIELTSYPSGVYIVVDERGNDMKVLVNNR